MSVKVKSDGYYWGYTTAIVITHNGAKLTLSEKTVFRSIMKYRLMTVAVRQRVQSPFLIWPKHTSIRFIKATI